MKHSPMKHSPMKHRDSTPFRRRRLPILVTLLAVALGGLLATVAQAKKNLIFEVKDARGDDHGNGHLEYPLREDFRKGDFDMVAFRAYDSEGGTTFEVEFAQQIRKPERGAIDTLGTDLTTVARHGFYTFNIDVYIDRDREPGSGGVLMVPGRNAEVAPEHAWDRAVVVTPRPPEVKSNLRRMWIQQMNEAFRQQVDGPAVDDLEAERQRAEQVRSTLAEKVEFPNRIRVRGRTISFFVEDYFLGGPAQADWSYVVVVTGADLISSFDLTAKAGLAAGINDNLMAIPISPGTWRDRMGGGREEAPNQPPIVDMFVPEGASQEKLLSEFTSRGEPRNATIPGVVPAALGSSGVDRNSR